MTDNHNARPVACQVPESVLAMSEDAARLDGRAALVTGAGRGAGRAHARLLAARGAAVVVNDIDAEVAHRTAADIQASGGKAVAIVADIARREEAERVIAEMLEAFGAIDILVHNAGIMYSATGLADTDDADFERLLGVNVRAPLYLTRAALPELRRSRAPRVIFINSQWGQVPDGHSYGYMVSKAAQLGLMKTLTQEFKAEGILFNAVMPGAIKTRMVPDEALEEELSHLPMGRLVHPEEIAAVVAFLASDQGAFIAGQAIPVNGGALVVGI